MHISELADKYVKNPTDVVKVQQKVFVTVVEVDLKRKRIALSMKKGSAEAGKPGSPEEKKKQAVPAPKPRARGEKKEMNLSRYEGNPFYEAFKKKRADGK